MTLGVCAVELTLELGALAGSSLHSCVQRLLAEPAAGPGPEAATLNQPSSWLSWALHPEDTVKRRATECGEVGQRHEAGEWTGRPQTGRTRRVSPADPGRPPWGGGVRQGVGRAGRRGVVRGPVSGVPGAQWTRAASKEGVSLGSGSQIARELVGV